MKNLLFIFIAMFTLGMTSCDVDTTEKGEMPEVDVDVSAEEGELPEYDVDWADINVGTKTKTVKVPKVQVVVEEEEVEVPYINADWPEDEDVMEQTITVEAEVVNYEHELEIEEVYAVGDRLYVISELEKEDTELGEETMRISDQIVINAPDLVVKHYIIGQKPDRAFNNNYTYINSKNEISDRLKNAEKIYD